MKEYLINILHTATFRQSSITFAGTVINGVLGALFYIYTARALGPADFGLLVISIMTITLIADIADLGTNTGLVRFVSGNSSSSKEKSLQFLKLSLEIKLLVWMIVLTLGLLTAPLVAQMVFNKPELTVPLRLSMIGVGGALLFTFVTSALQAFQRFVYWSIVNILSNLFRLLLIVGLIFIGGLTLNNSLLIYIIFPFFGFFLAMLVLPARKIIKIPGEYSVARELFSYNKWVALFTLIAAVSARLDTFISARLLSSNELGIYAAANQLSAVFPQIVSAIGVVVAPKFASFQNLKEMMVYFKKLQTMVLGIALVCLLVAPLSYYFIPWVYGSSFTQSIYPFIILLLAMLIFLISLPIHSSIFYYFGKPSIFVWVAIGHLSIISIGGYILISQYGVIGSALTVMLGMIFNFIVPLFWFLRFLKKR